MEALIAVLIYMALMAVIAGLLWKKLRRQTAAPQNTGLTSIVPDAASQLAHRDQHHRGDVHGADNDMGD